MSINDVLLPNLIIPGAAKSGTSSLHNYLDQHPHIQMSARKEPHIYSIDERFRARKDPQSPFCFNRIFHKDPSVRYYGESSTSYLPCRHAFKRIKNDNPTVRFILILRNPIKRTISHYRWLHKMGKIQRPFLEEIKAWEERLFNAENHSDGVYKYYHAYSSYFPPVKELYDLVREENVRIITQESLRAAPFKTINACFKFLDLPLLDYIKELDVNSTDANPKTLLTKAKRGLKELIFNQRHSELYKPTDSDLAYLLEAYANDVSALKSLTSRDFPEWPEFS